MLSPTLCHRIRTQPNHHDNHLLLRLPLPFPAAPLTLPTTAVSYAHQFPRSHANCAVRDDALPSNHRSNVSSLLCHRRVSGSPDGRRSSIDSRADLLFSSSIPMFTVGVTWQIIMIRLTHRQITTHTRRLPCRRRSSFPDGRRLMAMFTELQRCSVRLAGRIRRYMIITPISSAPKHRSSAPKQRSGAHPSLSVLPSVKSVNVEDQQ